MSARLVPVLVLLALLLAATAAAEPCPPDSGATITTESGAKPCDERGLPGVPALPQPLTAPTPPALSAPTPAPAPLGDGAPSLLGALMRMIGAVLVIAVLMAACVVGYRRLTRRAGARAGLLAWATGFSEDAGPDAVRVASRRSLGGRESVAVIHAGGERFLIGITSGQVSLIARLDTLAPEGEPDFTEALTRATAPRPDASSPPSAADTLRAAVERSRDRLGRLAHLSVVPRDARG
jgi:hypothetical protein